MVVESDVDETQMCSCGLPMLPAYDARGNTKAFYCVHCDEPCMIARGCAYCAKSKPPPLP